MKYIFIGILTFALTACTAAASPVPATPSLPPPTSVPSTPTADSVPPAPTASLPTQAAVIPNPLAYEWQMAAGGLRQPLDIQNAGDGSGRLFIVERGGRIRILEDGALLDAPFLDISGLVSTGGSEQGLLGLAFHPRFTENGWLYVNYTDRSGDTVIARFAASGSQADPASELRLLQVEQPYANHNGGGLAFGPDGYLYIGLGDGGSGGDPLNSGQSLDTLLGKLLRIDVDAPNAPYAVPADNPFVMGGGRPEIWAYGLRNPWRFSFDRATGDLYLGDVGQGAYEEVNFLPAGEPGGVNFGWNRYEGFQDYGPARPHLENHRPPVFQYSHAEGCSVTGGVTYRGASLPDWNGIHLFGDFCSGVVWGMLRQVNGDEEMVNTTALFDTNFNITAFGLDESGEVYLADYNAGAIYRLGKR